MKQFLSFLFICCAFQTWSQSIPKVDSMPSSGIVLANHWKWHSGDNRAWANPDFDDSKWEKISSTEPIHKIPKLREAEIAWFRRPINIGTSLINKSLCIHISQIGASEIYVDGKLIQKVGVVSKNPSVEQTETNTLTIPVSFADTSKHIIAVRFSHTKSNFYYPGSTLSIFQLRLQDTKFAGEWVQKQSKRLTGFYFFGMGIFLIFGILHFSFYASNRAKKVSLLLGITMFLLALAFLCASLAGNRTDISSKQIYLLITTISMYVGVLLINVSLYSYLSQPFKWIFYTQVILMAASLICNILDINLPGELESWPPFLIIFIDFIRVSILAERRGDYNAKVPINSLIVVAVCFLISIVILAIIGINMNFNSNDNNLSSYIVNFVILILLVMFFSIPIGLSLSLVREYTRTHKTLLHKLEEIESLSARSLIQEQEKQQILAAQNETLEKQVAERTKELKQSLENLKDTQAQLVQSEKLASLGELTAGIAHEIQNPLNFVNNFSELSVELIEELNEERSKEADKRDETLEVEILGDISQNLEKISHHGKRASSIVKGMLEHSRTSTGQKEAVDINAMVDEYLRLAYHGIRAKDKSFNSNFKTELEENLLKTEVQPQDLGRVLLNLINNAFYAVNQRSKKGDESYKPTVTVSTKQLANQIQISIKDNGTGMPESIKAKIFQPFFTTKPTGQGTGLGLSLAYDIITKGHEGTLEVETKEGEGTEFIIKLPLKNS